jgi:hypothetical protein
MKPLTAQQFWSLDRDERAARIAEAFDTGNCSACGKPILDGEPRNGLNASHYDCTDLGATLADDLNRLSQRIDDLIHRVKKTNR